MATLIKTARLSYLLLAFFSRSIFGSLFYDDEDLKHFRIKTIHTFCKRVLDILGMRVVTEGELNRPGQFLIVANHLSYIDALVISALLPSVFVTSVEVARTAFLGWIAKSAGAIFVERRNKSWVCQDVELIAQALKDGFNVVIFPEGTTSDGEAMLPFKMSLLQAALQTQVDVLPVCLNYHEVDGQPINSVSRDSVFYYGNMQFFSHLLRLLRLNSISLHLRFLEPIPVLQNPSRKMLARGAYEAIREHFIPVST